MTEEQISDLADRIADETAASCQWGEAYDTALAAIEATLEHVATPAVAQEPDAYMLVAPDGFATHLFFVLTNAQMRAEEQGLGSKVVPLYAAPVAAHEPTFDEIPAIFARKEVTREQLREMYPAKAALRGIITAVVETAGPMENQRQLIDDLLDALRAS